MNECPDNSVCKILFLGDEAEASRDKCGAEKSQERRAVHEKKKPESD